MKAVGLLFLNNKGGENAAAAYFGAHPFYLKIAI